MTYHLAQINIARLLAPMDDPRSKDFAQAIAAINLLAESSDGFVWRLKDDDAPESHDESKAASGAYGGATNIQAYDDPLIIVNMSVWESLESLRHFVYQSGHAQYVRRRRDWFEKPTEAFMACWWIPVGHVPTLDEAKERLASIEANGDTAFAFTFKSTFPAPSAV
jgi:Domain of unknown function (DUF3291)